MWKHWTQLPSQQPLSQLRIMFSSDIFSGLKTKKIHHRPATFAHGEQKMNFAFSSIIISVSACFHWLFYAEYSWVLTRTSKVLQVYSHRIHSKWAYENSEINSKYLTIFGHLSQQGIHKLYFWARQSVMSWLSLLQTNKTNE